MSDTPKFEVIDRRKFKAEEEHESEKAAHEAGAPAAEPEVSSGGPRLVVNEDRTAPDRIAPDQALVEALETTPEEELGAELPPPPSAEESREQKSAYDASARRLEDLVRAQNPAMGAQEGQRPRVDILGARTTIDLLGVLEEKTRGNLTEAENRALQAVLYEVRMAFLELTSMISLQAMQPPQPPPPGKR